MLLLSFEVAGLLGCRVVGEATAAEKLASE
jgi:hypothetical protein